MLNHTLLLFSIVIAIALLTVEPVDARKTKPKPPSGFLTKSVTIDKKTFNYAVFVPATYDGKKPFPIILALHGVGECGSDGLRQLTVGLGNAIQGDVAKWQRFIIVFPQKQHTEENWEEAESMVLAEFNQTLREFNIDKSRMYLTGLSQGGHGAFAIGSRHPELFAAVVPICGWGDKSLVQGLSKTPMWVFHGDADEVIDVNRSKEMVQWLKALDAPVKMTIYPGVGHGSWDKAYREEDIPGFFLQHHK